MASLLSLLLAVASVAPTANANGTTLPFQRHLIRLGSTLVAAVQEQGSDGKGLALYTSTDDGLTWRFDQDVQANYRIRDTADLVADGAGGFWLVYGVEPQSSKFGPYAGSDVVLLRYELLSPGRLGAEFGPLVLFRPAAGEGYFRPSIARDSLGAVHVAATRFDGRDFHWLVIDSRDGRSFGSPTELAYFGATAGSGRVLAYGNRVAAIFDDYGSGHPGRFRTKSAGVGGGWTSTVAFAADGLYHGGAFSAVATPDGKVHLGYSDKAHQMLHYRVYDGVSWSAPVTLESHGFWSNQPALTAEGDAISFAWNHEDGTSTYRIFQRTLSNGSWSALRTLDGAPGFKGYTTAIESVAAGQQAIVGWSWQHTINVGAATIQCARAAVP